MKKLCCYFFLPGYLLGKSIQLRCSFFIKEKGVAKLLGEPVREQIFYLPVGALTGQILYQLHSLMHAASNFERVAVTRLKPHV